MWTIKITAKWNPEINKTCRIHVYIHKYLNKRLNTSSWLQMQLLLNYVIRVLYVIESEIHTSMNHCLYKLLSFIKSTKLAHSMDQYSVSYITNQSITCLHVSRLLTLKKSRALNRYSKLLSSFSQNRLDPG